MTATRAERAYRYYDFVMAAFVVLLLCSNLIGAGKVCEVAGLRVSAAIFFFPMSYLLGDVLTEVYGYARDRRVVWAGFAALIFSSSVCWFTVKLPPAPGWPDQGAFETTFGQVPRIAFASLLAFWAGSFANSYVLARMKIWSEGRSLWMRTIGSTVVGEAVDSVIFYPLAFYGNWPKELLVAVMVSNYLLKCGWEALMTPITYKLVGWLKHVENEDFYDRDTNFTPFSLQN